jgi:hypothetical protein
MKNKPVFPVLKLKFVLEKMTNVTVNLVHIFLLYLFFSQRSLAYVQVSLAPPGMDLVYFHPAPPGRMRFFLRQFPGFLFGTSRIRSSQGPDSGGRRQRGSWRKSSDFGYLPSDSGIYDRNL